MLDAAAIAAYDAARPLAAQPFRAACYAPFTSLYFHPTGDVRACCMNQRHLLGNVMARRLDDIWNGAPIEAMRQAMLSYEFVKGCDSCIWQIKDGNLALDSVGYKPIHAMKYDEPPAAADGKHWPLNMEFNLSNACNLECVMCYGELSSLIRARREKLPPLPKAYGDEFFADLRKYLPHLQSASFLGGEPFLINENYRVWDMLIEMQVKLQHFITTNGTQYHAKVQRVLDRLPTSINISMDGVRKETLEGIRLNVNYEKLMDNFRVFHNYCQGAKTVFGVNFTLLRMNWREFREMLEFADAWDCNVSVCTSTAPVQYSLFGLSKAELHKVVEELQRQDAVAETPLRRNRGVWNATIDALVHRLENFDDDSLAFTRWVPEFIHEIPAPPKMTTPFALNRDGVVHDSAAQESHARQTLADWSPGAIVEVLECDMDDRVVRAQASSDGVLALAGDDLIGLTDQEIFGRLRSRLGDVVFSVDEQVSHQQTDRVVRFTEGDDRVTDIRVITLPRYDEQGALSGTRTYVALAPGGAMSLREGTPSA